VVEEEEEEDDETGILPSSSLPRTVALAAWPHRQHHTKMQHAKDERNEANDAFMMRPNEKYQ
jgi:hypothetical protein